MPTPPVLWCSISLLMGLRIELSALLSSSGLGFAVVVTQ
jgi:hypothetical protein